MNSIINHLRRWRAASMAAVAVIAAAVSVAYFQFGDDTSKASSLVPTVEEYAEGVPPDGNQAFVDAAADGRIDDDEYRDALEAARACMASAGIDATIVKGEGAAPDTIHAPIPPEGGSPENGPDRDMSAAIADCNRQHLAHFLRSQHLQQLNDGAARQEGFARFSECVRERGIPLEEDFTHNVLQERLLEATRTRSEEHARGEDGDGLAEAAQFMVAAGQCNQEVEKELGFGVY